MKLTAKEASELRRLSRRWANMRATLKEIRRASELQRKLDYEPEHLAPTPED